MEIPPTSPSVISSMTVELSRPAEPQNSLFQRMLPVDRIYSMSESGECLLYAMLSPCHLLQEYVYWQILKCPNLKQNNRRGRPADIFFFSQTSVPPILENGIVIANRDILLKRPNKISGTKHFAETIMISECSVLPLYA